MGDLYLWIIGLILLLAGILKAINPRPFISHINRFGLLPPKLSGLAAFSFIQIENALAVSLLLKLYLPQTILISTFLLLFLSIITLWGSVTGRIENCGCYGRMIWLKPHHSLLLNLFYMVGLGYVYHLEMVSDAMTWMGVFTLILTIGGTGFLIKKSLYHPLLNISPLRKGVKWKEKWALGDKQIDNGKILLFFITGECSECKKWRLILSEVPDNLFDGEIIFATSEKQKKILKSQQSDLLGKILFLPAFYYSYLIDRTPCAILLENKTIQNKWEKEFPYELFLSDGVL